MMMRVLLTILVVVALNLSEGLAKGPQKDSKKSQYNKGYSGKGIASPGNSAHSQKKSRLPTQSPVAATPQRPAGKFTLGRPAAPTSSIIGGRNASTQNRPTVQFPSRRPDDHGRDRGHDHHGGRDSLRQSPVVLYPQGNNSQQQGSRFPNTSRGRDYSRDRGRWGQGNTTINQPTIINQQNNITNNNITNNNVTNNWVRNNRVTNNTTNVNQWYRGNVWQNRVTINSKHWNGRPWWYKPDYGNWHHGNWHGRYYFRGRDSWRHVDTSQAPWLNGLVSWGLGNLVYRTGYQPYTNPYYLRPVVFGTTTINYSKPISVYRSQYELLYSNNEAKAQQLREQALRYFEVARQAFYLGDANRALDYINRAIALMPDDTSMHEFRALVLFSVGQYAEAAEVIHAVLAVAPGWDWTTMSGLYRDNDIYASQLRQLEQFVRFNPRRADARFLLAYHYITTGYPEQAEQQLRSSLILNPKDQLTSDLLALLREDNAKNEQGFSFGNSQLQPESLRGDWRAQRPDGSIELELYDGKFEWDYDIATQDQKFRGKYVQTGNLMLLASEDGSQMIGEVHQQDNNHFTFRLLGSNTSSPGLQFVRTR
ncbi:tetratricopeptide repeat protein [Calycomorphotria hydatis]|uniref:Tetratricopeptide repeat protein n=1 Tax=Calycomorphotria hydatis TaxID=2528027 RepID=A0A517T732_9PLAN|nr:tetratricopeptide repeat protein [Calycomorphotria hydatis]QDT64183.1 Tetratricopeptide repeat protein [Calycomorphotria hydatis]